MMTVSPILFLGHGLLTASIAAALLAVIPTFQPQRQRFMDRFLYAFYRAVPAWCLLQFILWLLQGRVSP